MGKAKKAILVVSIIILLIVVFLAAAWLFMYMLTGRMDLYHSMRYRGWKDYNFAKDMQFSIPKEWTVTQNDNAIYITDKIMEEDNYSFYLTGMVGVTEYDEEFSLFLSELCESGASLFASVNTENGGGRIFSSGARYKKGINRRVNNESIASLNNS